MLEIEMKFKVTDFAPLFELLTRWNAELHPPHVESDHYYSAPDRDFGVTDEALRLRRIGPRNILTYKGPKQPGPTKTRTEIEVPLEDGDAAAEKCLRFLEHLRYEARAVVRKVRQEYGIKRPPFSLQVCLDKVDELGKFVEVEIVAPPEQRDAAQTVLLSVVKELGLTQHEPRAYLQMALEKMKAT